LVVAADIDLPPPNFGSVTPLPDSKSFPVEQAIAEVAAWVSEAIYKGDNPRFPSTTRHALDELVWAVPDLRQDWRDDAREHAITVITESWVVVEAVAAALIERGSLSEDDLSALHATYTSASNALEGRSRNRSVKNP